MTTPKKKSRSRHNSNSHVTSYSFGQFVHDVLVFLAYFVNNFLFFCYHHVIFKTFFYGVKCLDHLYDMNPDFHSKSLEFLVSYFIVYTWLNRFSGKFDGYAFHHVLYYRYGMINFREMMARTLGTLCSSSLFGFLYFWGFPTTKAHHNNLLKMSLHTMLNSADTSTVLERLVYSNFNNETVRKFFKNHFTRAFVIPWLKFEDKYYDLLEKYMAMLFECFVVETTFSLFVYTLSSLMLKSRTPPGVNLALNTFVRHVFIAAGNMLLTNVDGKISLDESKWVFTFFSNGNVELLLVRLVANLVGALLIPVFVPMPRLVPLHEHKDLYPNTEIESKPYVSEFSYIYFVESNNAGREVRCSKWPNTNLGKLFLKLEMFLKRKLKLKLN